MQQLKCGAASRATLEMSVACSAAVSMEHTACPSLCLLATRCRGRPAHMEHLSDRNFVKILEYLSIARNNGLEMIARRLSLQVFYETQPGVIYTIASVSFVIDVYQSSIKVYFVDSSLQSSLSYVEKYMNYYFARHKYKTLYFILRYLMKCEGEPSACSLECRGVMCECIFTDSPSVVHSFRNPKEVPRHHIFTHRRGEHTSLPGSSLADLKARGEARMATTIDGDDVVADTSGSVYVNGTRNAPMAYLYKRGADLEMCYDFIMK